VAVVNDLHLTWVFARDFEEGGPWELGDDFGNHEAMRMVVVREVKAVQVFEQGWIVGTTVWLSAHDVAAQASCGMLTCH
jgi:hypothetical protein